MPIPGYDPEKQKREQKKKQTIIMLLVSVVLIYGGIYLVLQLKLGSVKTLIAPVKQTTEPVPMTPAPCGKSHPALAYADWMPYFFHEKLVYCDSNYQVHVKTDIEASRVVLADRFNEGLARVVLKGKEELDTYIYIGLNGKVELDSDPRKDYCGVFSEGLACAVEKDSGKLGFMDKTGKFVISPRFFVSMHTSGVQVQRNDQLENCLFSCNLAPVYNDKINAKELSPSCGYINHKGKFVIPVKYVEGYPFKDDRARVCIKDESKFGRRWGFIDTKGKIVLKPIHMQVQDYSDNMAAVLDYRGKWGYVDKSGDYAIAAQYSDAMPFSEEIAAVAIVKDSKPKWGYVRNDGGWLVEPRFDRADPFKNGEARAYTGDETDLKSQEAFTVDLHGKVEKVHGKTAIQ